MSKKGKKRGIDREKATLIGKMKKGGTHKKGRMSVLLYCGDKPYFLSERNIYTNIYSNRKKDQKEILRRFMH